MPAPRTGWALLGGATGTLSRPGVPRSGRGSALEMARFPQPGATRSSAPSTVRAAQVEVHGKVRVKPFARPGESSEGSQGHSRFVHLPPPAGPEGAPGARPGRRGGQAATESDRLEAGAGCRAGCHGARTAAGQGRERLSSLKGNRSLEGEQQVTFINEFAPKVRQLRMGNGGAPFPCFHFHASLLCKWLNPGNGAYNRATLSGQQCRPDRGSQAAVTKQVPASSETAG